VPVLVPVGKTLVCRFGLHVLIYIVVGIVALALLNRASKRRQQKNAARDRKARAQTLFDQTRAFFSQIETAGGFHSLETPSLHLQDGEFAILYEAGATLHAFKSHQVSVGNGGRGVAGISLYPAAWEWGTDDEMSPIAKGDLYLTNKRLLFVSDHRNRSIPWENLLSIHARLIGFRIHTNDSESAVGFATENGLLWTMLIRWMSSTEVKMPKLASGTKITLTSEGIDELEQKVELTVHTPD